MDQHSLECLDFFRIRDLLADYAMTGLGRSLAVGIHPVTRVGLVQRWLAQVGELQRMIEERGVPPFGGISDIREVVQRCAPPLRVTVDEVARVGTTLLGTHAMTQYLRELPESYPELRHLAERIGDFRTIAERIGAVIDERGQVRDTASPKLQRVRAEIAEATRQIDQVVARILREPDVRRLLQYPNHTFHGDRIVVPLRTEYRGRLPGIVHRASDSGATLYVEPGEVVELNNRISNLRSEEQEEVGRLLWDLAHEIHLNGREIHKTLETLAVLGRDVVRRIGPQALGGQGEHAFARPHPGGMAPVGAIHAVRLQRPRRQEFDEAVGEDGIGRGAQQKFPARRADAGIAGTEAAIHRNRFGGKPAPLRSSLPPVQERRRIGGAAGGNHHGEIGHRRNGTTGGKRAQRAAASAGWPVSPQPSVR